MWKLVRDRSPEFRRNAGEDPDYFFAADQLKMLLKSKLKEETQELLETVTKAEVAEEIADVLEVLEGIASVSGLRWSEVLDAKTKKFEEKGGFKKGVVLYVEE